MVSGPARGWKDGGTIIKVSKTTGIGGREGARERERELEWERNNEQEGENLLGFCLSARKCINREFLSCVYIIMLKQLHTNFSPSYDLGSAFPHLSSRSSKA